MTDILEVDKGTMQGTPRWSLGPVIFGVALIIAGVSWILDRLDVVDVNVALVIPLALLAVGVALMVGSFEGVHGGLVATGVILTLIVVLGSVTPLDAFRGGIGERNHRPQSVGQVDEQYRLGIGSLKLDLSGLAITTDVETLGELGIGEIVVTVPDNVPLEVTAQLDAGEIEIFGEKRSGTEVEYNYTSPGFSSTDDTLTLDLDVFLGSIKVVRP